MIRSLIRVIPIVLYPVYGNICDTVPVSQMLYINYKVKILKYIDIFIIKVFFH